MIVIRVISFSIDQKMSDYIVGKSRYTSIAIDMVFGQYQADFEARVYEEFARTIDDKIVKAGMDLVTQRTVTLPI